MVRIGMLIIIALVIGVGSVFAACQVPSQGLQVSVSPITLSIPNGRLDSVELTVKNPMTLTAGSVYVNNEPVITLSPSQTGVISIPVSAPALGSGSGTSVKDFDVMIVGEGKCWDKTMQVAVSYFPSQEEIAAQQTRASGICPIVYVMGAFLFVGVFFSVKRSQFSC